MTDILLDVPMEAAEAVEGATEILRPFLTTPFTDYTVTEGFLLLFLSAGFCVLMIWFFKGGS